MIDEADSLRTPQNAFDPDPRTKHLVLQDKLSSHIRQVTLADQTELISTFALNRNVPNEITIHFETAKNLYLYSWFVFRFYPVAEQQALTTLEYALRLSFPEFVKDHSEKNRFKNEPGLKTLIKHAAKSGRIKNELFPSHMAWASQRAKSRFSHLTLNEMVKAGLDEMEYDDSSIEPNQDDLNHDWIKDFIEHIPALRNDLAHGSPTLHHTVIHTFDVVSSMINMLFPDTNEAPLINSANEF
jgi:hypothetical protein